ncbi:uncharacterized protein EAF01_008937 [Botrytis porri]|uniref:uncharacterized protein n=1 Tax=Botrytis porri TaxID=87229 RepID=UPI0019028709|nr:uncharacterized protein EAF01_008937 [Botrytis porri]KAF7897971.1 hypothetical protein EAF01_008937 [Botrytis porri]
MQVPKKEEVHDSTIPHNYEASSKIPHLSPPHLDFKLQTHTLSIKQIFNPTQNLSKLHSLKMPFEQPVVEQQIQSEAPMSSENIGIEMQQPKPVPTMGTETNLRGGESAGCECCGCGCGEQCC